MVVVSVVALASGMAVGVHARDVALHSSLRAVLERDVGGASIDRLDIVHRHEPIAIRAVLTQDAADAGEFVSLRVAANALRVGPTWQPVSGGLVLTVNGVTERRRVGEWRAG